MHLNGITQISFFLKLFCVRLIFIQQTINCDKYLKKKLFLK